MSEKYMANVIKSFIWDKTGVEKFGKLLDMAAMRHKLISGNIANVSTPGYSSRDIDFKKEMQQALGSGPMLTMASTNSRHISNAGMERKPEVIEHGAETDEDLNGVDIDTEITNLAVNQMEYSIGARLLQRQMEALRAAIRGR
jgi:flagellar basal-body rod protein FlgB